MVDDVMHCMFGNIKREKEFERPVTELEMEHTQRHKSKCRSLGKDTVKPDILQEWADELKEGKCPAFLRIIESCVDGVRYLDSVPEKPIDGVHFISHFHTPLAKFENGQWVIGTASENNEHPPITSEDIPVIGGVQTITSAEVLEQMAKKETESIDDFIDSKNSDINNDSNPQKEIGDIYEEII
jgi:hypothetical protein